MRVQQMLSALLLCLPGAGCAMYETVTRNVVRAALDSADDKFTRRRDRRWAEAAWDDWRRQNRGEPFSADYGSGFRDGYADTLDGGGRAVPPAVPPWRYRRPRYQTPAGYRAVEDWYAGFQDGAAAALAEGPRHPLTLPPSGVTLKAAPAPPPPGLTDEAENGHPIPPPRWLPPPGEK
jgi:hypothetical protein